MWRSFILPSRAVPLLVLLTLAGCAERQAEREKEPAITLRAADRQVYDDLLMRHQGEVVLVDFWATWCLSCMEQFPYTVGLHEKYASEGLAVISVCLDDPENETAVREFLKTHHAVFDNLLSKWGSGDQSFEAFAIDSGTLPEYRLYDRNGRLCETFSVDPSADKQFTPEDVEQSVRRLLDDDEVNRR